MKQVIFLCLNVMLIFSLFSFAHGYQNGKGDDQPGQTNESQTDETYFYFEGVVIAAQEIKMKTSSKGVVAGVHATIGDRVKTGELILTLKAIDSNDEIKNAQANVKKWEKILFNRQHWRVRSGAAERQAERKLKEAQEILDKLKQKYADIKIYSLINGKVTSIVGVGKMVEEDSVVAEILDDSTLKTSFSSDSEVISRDISQFTDGKEIFLTFKEVEGEFTGSVKKIGNTINIIIPNPDFILAAGMRARFRMKSVEVQPQKSTVMEPAVKESPASAVKKNGQKKKKKIKKEPVSQRSFEPKKIEYEFSMGLGLSFSDELYYRESAIDTLMGQYAQNYGVEYTSSGAFSKSVMFFPIQAMVNYRLKKNIFLKGGLEYGFSSSSPQNLYRVMWDGFTEDHDYSLTNKLSYIMPFFGGELRFSSFGIYVHLGLNFFSLNHKQVLDYSDGPYWSNREDNIKANGTGFGFLLGGKYRIRLKKKVSLLIKLEGLYISVGSLNGRRDTSILDSNGAAFSESVDGTLLLYEMNPYDQEWFLHWDLYASNPDETWIRNVSNLKLNLYSIRLLLGIIF